MMNICAATIHFLVVVFNIIPTGFAEDKSGYVMYCPCMGRFGNQADHFLGSLAFAKTLNRTLIVPPWINHHFASGYQNSFVPYDKWFNLDALKQYHRVVLMEDFMKNEATTIWTPKSRKVYCHRKSMERSTDKQSCPAKVGNPFGPFWNNFDIDFSSSEAYPASLNYFSSKMSWDREYPVAKNPVLTFMGAPASYPVKENHKEIQKYVEWSDEIRSFASDFIQKNLKRPYVGIHLRNGNDWKRACDHVKEDTDYPFMSSPQCVGVEDGKSRMFTSNMCFPSKQTVIEQCLEMVNKYNAKSLFIASDNEFFVKEFKETFSSALLDVEIVRLGFDYLIKDLAVLIEADGFLGSCASSVTAFVVRKRTTLNRPCHFVGVKPSYSKSEL